MFIYLQGTRRKERPITTLGEVVTKDMVECGVTEALLQMGSSGRGTKKGDSYLIET